ncbi:MAG: TldD/PmbA family protein [Ruminococcus sp.]|nr:TldD/PmbA family protein [Ruminococcus sp.]
MYRFPEGLYCDVRIERSSDASYSISNGEVSGDSETAVTGAVIRVYDGDMWYNSVTNDIDSIQREIDALAELAKPRADINELPEVAVYEVNKVNVTVFGGEKDLRNVSRSKRIELVNSVIKALDPDSFDEIKNYRAAYSQGHTIKEFYSSKGAEIIQDYQSCTLGTAFEAASGDNVCSGTEFARAMSLDELSLPDEKIKAKRDRVLDFLKNAVPVEAGEMTCVLAPVVTAMFTHESFGHKSEADFMLNDETLRAEWVMGKTVGSSLVSICDSGDMINNGYVPYDDEGTRSKETWLIKNGVLTGRLHDAKSAAVMGEELTGNSRAESYRFSPMVRMTNTYMSAGDTSPEELIAGVKDGLYVYSVIYGTGNSTFTLKPHICYRIRDGKLCEPVRANVITGSVFRTLFDIDGVGSDLEIFNTYTCGKNGQSVPVSAGGPTIRVRSLNVN